MEDDKKKLRQERHRILEQKRRGLTQTLINKIQVRIFSHDTNGTSIAIISRAKSRPTGKFHLIWQEELALRNGKSSSPQADGASNNATLNTSLASIVEQVWACGASLATVITPVWTCLLGKANSSGSAAFPENGRWRREQSAAAHTGRSKPCATDRGGGGGRDHDPRADGAAPPRTNHGGGQAPRLASASSVCLLACAARHGARV